MGRAGLEIVSIVEWSTAGEEEGGSCWVKLGGCKGERGDVKGLEMRICMPVDLHNIQINDIKRGRGKGKNKH